MTKSKAETTKAGNFFFGIVRPVSPQEAEMLTVFTDAGCFSAGTARLPSSVVGSGLCEPDEVNDAIIAGIKTTIVSFERSRAGHARTIRPVEINDGLSIRQERNSSSQSKSRGDVD